MLFLARREKTSQLLDTLMVILAKAKSLSSIIQKLNRGGGTREEGAASTRAAQAANTALAKVILHFLFGLYYNSLGALNKFHLKISVI